MGPVTDRHSRVVRSGVFEVDIERRQLRKHGVRIKLRNQPFQVLVALIERPGELVTRERLYELLWPGETFVDFEHNLNAIVKSLRRALGDSAERPLFIETQARRGYRFIAAVEIDDGRPQDANQGELPEPMAAEVEQPAKRHASLWLVATVCLLLLGVFAFYGKSILWPSQQLDRLSAPDALNLDMSFSPDGRWLTYASDFPNHQRFNIFVQEVGSTNPRRVTNYAGDDCSPVFSPSGTEIAFTRAHRELMVVPAVGGSERRVAEVDNPSPMGLDYADGKSIASVDRIPGSKQFAIFLVSLATGEKRQLTFPPAGSRDDNFRFSPDGRQLAFIRQRTPDTNQLYVMPAGGGPARLLATAEFDITAVGWTEDGGEVLYSTARLGRRDRIFRVPATGGASRPVDLPTDHLMNLAVSRAGHRLAYAVIFHNVNIWRAELSQPGNHVGSYTRTIGSSRLNHSPEFSPDGQWIAFSSDRTGSAEIWLAKSDGSAVRPLARVADADNPQWSPDGKSLVFDAAEYLSDDPSRSVWSVYRLNVAAGRPQRISHGPNFQPSWSRDGQWIYFSSTRNGSTEIWKMKPDGGGEVQVTYHGGQRPLDSPDGRTIYYEKVGDDPTEIWRVPAGGGDESPAMTLKGKPIPVASSHWSPVSDGIYFLNRQAPPPDLDDVHKLGYFGIRFFRFGSSGVQSELDMGRYSQSPGGLSVSPDRRMVVWGQLDQWEGPIMIVNNFR
jgi:Tol biopolymer transport system component/DNA-binding winged helix-turn-helix (wHTH) protein